MLSKNQIILLVLSGKALPTLEIMRGNERLLDILHADQELKH